MVFDGSGFLWSLFFMPFFYHNTFEINYWCNACWNRLNGLMVHVTEDIATGESVGFTVYCPNRNSFLTM
jgi:hypothetical protein